MFIAQPTANPFTPNLLQHLPNTQRRRLMRLLYHPIHCCLPSSHRCQRHKKIAPPSPTLLHTCSPPVVQLQTSSHVAASWYRRNKRLQHWNGPNWTRRRWVMMYFHIFMQRITRQAHPSPTNGCLEQSKSPHTPAASCQHPEASTDALDCLCHHHAFPSPP